MRKRKVKVAKKVITKAFLMQAAEELKKEIAWATKIIQTQQQEIDRLTTLNSKLINAIDQLSSKD